MLKPSLIALSAAAALAGALPAQAQDTGNFIVRARAVHLDSSNKDSTPYGLSINNKWLPEVDISLPGVNYPELSATTIVSGAVGR